MRSAQYITSISKDELDRVIDALDLRPLIDREEVSDIPLDPLLDGDDTMLRCVGPILLPGGHWNGAHHVDLGMWSCMFAPPHRDSTIHNYTAGLVLRGNHYLFTGHGRKVCDLKPGTVYLLNNKRMHGAYPNPGNDAHDPLVFIALDFSADSMADALKKVSTS